VGLASFSPPQPRGGRRKAQVCEAGLERIFCKVPSSKGNLYLWRTPGPARASRFLSLLYVTGFWRAPIWRAGSSSSQRSPPFFIEVNWIQTQSPQAPRLASINLSPFRAGYQSTEWQMLSVNRCTPPPVKGKRRKRERGLQIEY